MDLPNTYFLIQYIITMKLIIMYNYDIFVENLTFTRKWTYTGENILINCIFIHYHVVDVVMYDVPTPTIKQNVFIIFYKI